MSTASYSHVPWKLMVQTLRDVADKLESGEYQLLSTPDQCSNSKPFHVRTLASPGVPIASTNIAFNLFVIETK